MGTERPYSCRVKQSSAKIAKRGKPDRKHDLAGKARLPGTLAFGAGGPLNESGPHRGSRGSHALDMAAGMPPLERSRTDNGGAGLSGEAGRLTGHNRPRRIARFCCHPTIGDTP